MFRQINVLYSQWSAFLVTFFPLGISGLFLIKFANKTDSEVDDFMSTVIVINLKPNKN